MDPYDAAETGNLEQIMLLVEQGLDKDEIYLGKNDKRKNLTIAIL